jgi:hypothetical protein
MKEQFRLHCLPTDEKYNLKTDSKAYIIEWVYRDIKLLSKCSSTSGLSTLRGIGYVSALESGSASGQGKESRESLPREVFGAVGPFLQW